jgi:hypothetical protein
MLCVISFRPGFKLSIFAGVVCEMLIELLEGKRNGITDLGVFAAFKKWRDANETDIVIPHHNVILVISRNFEGVLEDCNRRISMGR